MMILKIVSTISCWIQTPQKYGKSSQIIIIPLYLYSIRIFIVFNKDDGKKKQENATHVFLENLGMDCQIVFRPGAPCPNRPRPRW